MALGIAFMPVVAYLGVACEGVSIGAGCAVACKVEGTPKTALGIAFIPVVVYLGVVGEGANTGVDCAIPCKVKGSKPDKDIVKSHSCDYGQHYAYNLTLFKD